MPPDPPSLVCLYKLDIHVTPLLKILATGLVYIANCLCKKLQNQEKIMIIFLIAGFVIRHTKT